MTDPVPVLYGFNGSAFVRSVRMLLAETQAAYDHIPVDLIQGEHREPAHLERNPFGKVPVLEHDGMTIYETDAIQRYLDRVLPGPSFVPENASDGARMSMAIGIVDSFGYSALVGGVTAFHLFPDFFGGVTEAQRQEAITRSKLVLGEIMKLKGADPFIAGNGPTLADFHLAPCLAYVAITPDAEEIFAVPGVKQWWEELEKRPSFPYAHP